ncbi:unnamed protein product, partial [Laminaria digitata]
LLQRDLASLIRGGETAWEGLLMSRDPSSPSPGRISAWHEPCPRSFSVSRQDARSLCVNLALTGLDITLSPVTSPVHALRPGIVGMRGSMVIRLRPCMILSTPPPAPR